MNNLTPKQKLQTYGEFLKEFKTPTIQLILKEIITNTPTIYFGASTSSTGKYHPLATNGLSGLVKHSVAVMLTAKDLLENETVSAVFRLNKLSPVDKEIFLAAALIHDNAKYGADDLEDLNVKYYTQGNHPRMVKDIAEKAGLYTKLTEEQLPILNKMFHLIETHMGQWTFVKNGEPLEKPQDYSQSFIHMCDYIVSRKTFDNVANISLPSDVDPELIAWFQTQN